MYIENYFKSSDGVSDIYYQEWIPDEGMKAIVQVAHGMAEHGDRYKDFGLYLNGYGIALCVSDYIGHGKSAKKEDWGFMGSENGWVNITEDVELYRQIIDSHNSNNVPHILLGHSMGSFVARRYMSLYGNNVDGAIIMGTAGKNPATGVGIALVRFLRKLKGERNKSKLITDMAFGSYCNKINDAKSSFDWLSAESSNVEKYIEDPACGFTFTLAAYEDLFRLMAFVSSEDCYIKIPFDKPILITSGEEDPVGAYGKGPREVYEKLKAKGCKNVTLAMYPCMRHEILNETEKEKVYEDIKNWILTIQK